MTTQTHAQRTRVLLRVPTETADWMTNEAARYGISRNGLMLVAIEKYRRDTETAAQLPNLGAMFAQMQAVEAEAKQPKSGVVPPIVRIRT